MNTIQTAHQPLAVKLIISTWAASSKSIRCKSTLIPCNEYIREALGRERVSIGTGIHRKSGWMRASHHLMYNIIRDKEPSLGFTKSIKPGKRDAFKAALDHLRYLHKLAILQQTNNKAVDDRFYERRHKHLVNFLEPFGVPIEYFVAMTFPES